MDLLPMRVQNIFNSMFKPKPVELNPNQIDIAALAGQPSNAELFTPEREASGKLMEYLNSQPKREDFQPSRMTNILSRIQALGGSGAAGQANGQMIGYKSGGADNIKMQDYLLNRGYSEAQEDWGAKLKPIQELADAEANRNTQGRIMANTIIRDRTANRGIESREGIAQGRLQLGRDQLDQKEKYANRLFTFKYYALNNPNMKIQQLSDGTLVGINPKTGEVQELKDDDGQPLTGADLPELEKIRLQHTNRLSEIAAQGGQTRQNIAAQGEKEVDVAERTLEPKKELKTTTPGSSKNTAGTGTGKNKKGDRKVYPNGNVGEWTGTGWKLVGTADVKPAK